MTKDNSEIRVLVTGGTGQLGQTASEMVDKYPYFKFTFAEKGLLDITAPGQVESFLTENRIQVVINAAAYTAVDKAEEEREKAFAVNEIAAGTLAEACARHDIILVHISTDYVFDGEKREPYNEGDQPNPLNVYGASKLAGEVQVLTRYPEAIIIRSSWLVSNKGANFVRTMLGLGRGRESLRVVNDQVASPTWTRSLFDAIMMLVGRKMDGENLSGIFHFTHSGTCSWAELASYLFQKYGITCEVQPVSTEEYNAPAVRPSYSKLDTTRIEALGGLEMISWQEAMDRLLKESDNGNH